MKGLIQNHQKKIAAIVIATPFVAGFEGLRQYVYRDPVGIPTFCFGETKNPEWGKRYSLAECHALKANRMQEFADGVAACLRVDVQPHRYAALVSFAYNVGTGAACSSSVVRRLNAGEGAAACDSLMLWTKARGIEFPGLVRRRAAEREMCRRED